MNQEKIGKFIAAQRKDKKLTQSQLAEKLGITDRAVSKWETGKSLPDTGIMLELCETLEITVNELLSGEIIEMTNYDKKAEEMLLNMAKKEEAQNKKLMIYEFVIGIMSTIILIASLLVSMFLIETLWIQHIVIGISFVIFLVGIFFALKIETETGYYECKNCGHKYVPKFLSVLWAPHNGTTRYLKCPECHKRTWNKKRMSK